MWKRVNAEKLDWSMIKSVAEALKLVLLTPEDAVMSDATVAMPGPVDKGKGKAWYGDCPWPEVSDMFSREYKCAS